MSVLRPLLNALQPIMSVNKVCFQFDFPLFFLSFCSNNRKQTGECTFSVMVIDVESPKIVCRANIDVENDAGVCGASVNYGEPEGRDNCPAPTTNQTAGQAPNTLFPVGATTNQFTVYDASSNQGISDFDLCLVACMFIEYFNL
jgi:hypothetical protein